MITRNHGIRAVLYRTLYNLSKVLVNSDFAFREFIEIAKLAYIDSIRDNLQSSGKRISTSSISRISGLSRPETKRLSEKSASGWTTTFDSKPTPQGLVLQVWFTIPEFLDSQGRPKSLSKGSGPNSFESLVDYCDVKIDPVELLDSLLTSGHVEGDETLTPTQRFHSVTASGQGLEVALDISLHAMSKTLSHNMGSPKNKRWIHRVVRSQGISASDLAFVRRSAHRHASDFCENIDNLFDARAVEVADDRNSTDNKIAGLGVFYFEE